MATQALDEENARFALGKLLERLNEGERRGNPVLLNEWEVRAVGEVLRDHLAGAPYG